MIIMFESGCTQKKKLNTKRINTGEIKTFLPIIIEGLPSGHSYLYLTSYVTAWLTVGKTTNRSYVNVHYIYTHTMINPDILLMLFANRIALDQSAPTAVMSPYSCSIEERTV